MPQVSYSALYGIRHEREHDEPIHPGDRVRTGLNAMPRFTVIAVHNDMVWLRNLDSGLDGVVPLNRCRRLEA